MGCSQKSTLINSARTTVSVNGTAIPHDVIAREVQNHPAKTPAMAWMAAARALVVRELLMQEARRQAITAPPALDQDGRRETEAEAMVRALVEQEVGIPEADEQTCRRYCDRNRHRFRSPDIYRAAHILIPARRDQPEAFAAARETATALLVRLSDDPSRFAELAAAHSACPSAASGGNLGQITAGATTPEFEAALAALVPGEMTEAPVETRYGFHIVRLDRHIPGRELPFELIRGRIAEYLAESARRTAIAQFVARLAARADIRGVDLPMPSDIRVD